MRPEDGPAALPMQALGERPQGQRREEGQEDQDHGDPRTNITNAGWVVRSAPGSVTVSSAQPCRRSPTSRPNMGITGHRHQEHQRDLDDVRQRARVRATQKLPTRLVISTGTEGSQHSGKLQPLPVGINATQAAGQVPAGGRRSPGRAVTGKGRAAHGFC
jgi:hypothetical protein